MSSATTYGSCLFSEDEFVSKVEGCCYPNAEFKHADHIRLAWIYLRRYGLERAEERIAVTIRRFAASLGHQEKYHETVTRAWLRLVATAQCATPEAASFEDFIEKHGWLLERTALSAFYTKACLSSEVARRQWVEPDRRPLPCASSVTVKVGNI